MPDEAAVKCIWQSIATFLGGSFVGTWLGHFLAIGRDKRNQRHAHDVAREARKNNLLAYLNVWSSEVAANRRSADANNVVLTIAEQFDGKRLEVIRQATPMESDFRAIELPDSRTWSTKSPA